MHSQSGRGASHEALARSKPRLEFVHGLIGDLGRVGMDERQTQLLGDRLARERVESLDYGS